MSSQIVSMRGFGTGKSAERQRRGGKKYIKGRQQLSWQSEEEVLEWTVRSDGGWRVSGVSGVR